MLDLVRRRERKMPFMLVSKRLAVGKAGKKTIGKARANFCLALAKLEVASTSSYRLSEVYLGAYPEAHLWVNLEA